MISGHSCISKEVPGEPNLAEYGDLRFPFSFPIPKGTFILSFSEPGSSTCFFRDTELYLQRNQELVRQFFTLHGADELEGHTKGSMFSRAIRATGTPDTPIEFPNVNYTFDPDDKEESREENMYGVFDITSQASTGIGNTRNIHSLIPQFDPSLDESDTNKSDWLLKDIIEHVYRVTGVKKGIFLSMGCHGPCKGADASIDRAEKLFRHADIMYRNIIPVVSRRNITRRGIRAEPNTSHLRNASQLLIEKMNTMEPSQLRRLLNSGLYNARAFLDPKIFHREFHPVDYTTIQKMTRKYLKKKKLD